MLRPGQTQEFYESHDILAIGALRVRRLPPLDPGLKATGYGKIKLLHALANGRCGSADEDRRESPNVIGDSWLDGFQSVYVNSLNGRQPAADRAR